MKLYRYRTVASALMELENGAFYFAEPDELNDPIEGYAKIFWQGDKPAWQGLLKNFVCSLFYTLQTHLLMSERFHCAAQENFFDDLLSKSLLLNFKHFDDSPLNKIFNELAEKFLTVDTVQSVVDFYGGNVKCYGREMEFILRAVTDAAFKICVGKCKTLGLIDDEFDENFFDVAYEISFAELKSIDDAERKRRIDELENLNCDVMESGLLALKLDRRAVTDSTFRFKRNMLWLRFMFPRTYRDRLKEIMYPNGYVVCFSNTPTNSAMWGNYADNHRGICFVYETENFDGRELMTFAAKSLEVKPVKYGTQIIERNFFDTLRHLKFLRAQDWLTGLDGEKSCKLAAVAADGYDDDYREKFYRKSDDWHHEHEYRIFLPDKFYHYNNRFARQLPYDLKMLTGMIFGIRTTLDDKLELIQKLVRLRKSLGDFEFFQAEYDDETQIISVREKILLTVSC